MMDFAMATATAAVQNRFRDAAVLIRAGRWQEGIERAAHTIKAGHAATAEVRLLVAIAHFRAGLPGGEPVCAELIKAADGLRDVRLLLVGPLQREARYAEALGFLDLCLAAAPSSSENLILRARVHARQRQWDAAIADADRAAALVGEDNSAVLLLQLQCRMQAGQFQSSRMDEAAQLVASLIASLGDTLPADQRLAEMVLLFLIRRGEMARAADLAETVPTGSVTEPGLAGSIVQALYRAGRFAKAIELGERFIDWGHEGTMLRSHLAQAWYDGGSAKDRFERAIGHLEFGVAMAPEDVRMGSMLGDLLLRTGKTERARAYLADTVERHPNLAHVRALYARALKQLGDYSAAADQFVTLMETAPEGGRNWQRYAAGALAQAGRTDAAADVFDKWVDQRRAALPPSFEDGLKALWDRVPEVRIPQARLDWAWSLRAPDCDLERGEWERRAAWGHLADHLLLDWLECRDELVEEAMYHFSDELDRLEVFVAEARARAEGKGVVFASAHVGAMYFGPLALELIGARSRWVASTPSVARTSYAESLISTSDQTEAGVARAFMQSLKKDFIVVVVVDGAINLAAPRVMFEGQEVTYSEFASRMAYRMGSSSAFVAPVWQDDGKLGFVLEHLPLPDEGESADDYAARWQAAYLGHLRQFLGGKPENLRIAGGIWRLVR